MKPICVGNVRYEGEIYRGRHEAILESQIWENVQEILDRRGRTRIPGRRVWEALPVATTLEGSYCNKD